MRASKDACARGQAEYGFAKNLVVAVVQIHVLVQAPISQLEGLPFHPDASSIEVDLADNGVPYPVLPAKALAVLQPFLRAWREVKADAERMKAYPLSLDDVTAIVDVASSVCQAVGLSGKLAAPFSIEGVQDFWLSVES